MLAIRLVTGPVQSAALVIPVRPVEATGGAEPVPTSPALPAELVTEITALLPEIEHTGAPGVVYRHVRPLATPSRLFVLGVGAGDEPAWRAAGAALARAAAKETSITVTMPAELTPDAVRDAVRGLAEGLWLASYRFHTAQQVADAQETGAQEAGADQGSTDEPKLGEVELVVADPALGQQALAAAQVTATSTWFARDLTNTPSAVKNPAWFADQVRHAATGLTDLDVRVREPEQLAAEGFGGILAVGGGSVHGPRLVELSWRPPGAHTHVVLVGKGITFDTGGISIKPRAGMKLMRKDMGGAAAVVATAIGAARLNLPVRVTALAPLAENMPSGSAYRPGDVIHHYGGLTSESTNTDAEGRLVLADALSYAVHELDPDFLVDLATLTGANAVALGKRTAALYSENDQLAEAVLAAAAAAGEGAWRMPLPADYVEYLGSDIADLYSAPTQGAGSVVAALYLREFTGKLRDRWLHLDMSAPSWSESNDGELVKGATGWGVRTLLRWLAGLAA